MTTPFGYAIVSRTGKLREFYRERPVQPVAQFDQYPETSNGAPHRVIELHDITAAPVGIWNAESHGASWGYGAELIPNGTRVALVVLPE